MGQALSLKSDGDDVMVDHGALSMRQDSPYATSSAASSWPWDEHIVQQLILSRRLPPFYKGLDAVDSSWSNEAVCAALGGNHLRLLQQLNSENNNVSTGSSQASTSAPSVRMQRLMAKLTLYKGAIECPLCFLYYPSNMLLTRCCAHELCLDCFLQIKRAVPDVQQLVSSASLDDMAEAQTTAFASLAQTASLPACCPYCQETNFGVTYTPPPVHLRQGKQALGEQVIQLRNRSSSDASRGSGKWNNSALNRLRNISGVPPPPPQPDSPRRRSISHQSQSVVTSDMIRPDWQTRLQTLIGQQARKSARRIVMRHVEGRLIPVGITRASTIMGPGAAVILDDADLDLNAVDQPLRRLLRRQRVVEMEEAMVAEAVRLSLLEEQERAEREAEAEMLERLSLRPSLSQHSDQARKHPDPASPVHQEHASGTQTPC